MAGAYTMDLRERVVQAYDDGAGSYKEIAERFCIGEATLSRWLGRRRRTGSLEPKVQGGARTPRKVDEEGERFLAEVLELLPDSTLGELVEAYEDHTGTTMHASTMGRSLARMGYTRKRGLFVRRRHFEKT